MCIRDSLGALGPCWGPCGVEGFDEHILDTIWKPSGGPRDPPRTPSERSMLGSCWLFFVYFSNLLEDMFLDPILNAIGVPKNYRKLKFFGSQDVLKKKNRREKKEMSET